MTRPGSGASSTRSRSGRRFASALCLLSLFWAADAAALKIEITSNVIESETLARVGPNQDADGVKTGSILLTDIAVATFVESLGSSIVSGEGTGLTSNAITPRQVGGIKVGSRSRVSGKIHASLTGDVMARTDGEVVFNVKPVDGLNAGDSLTFLFEGMTPILEDLQQLMNGGFSFHVKLENLTTGRTLLDYTDPTLVPNVLLLGGAVVGDDIRFTFGHGLESELSDSRIFSKITFNPKLTVAGGSVMPEPGTLLLLGLVPIGLRRAMRRPRVAGRVSSFSPR